MVIKISVDMPDIACIYCSSSDTEIISYSVSERNLIDISYGCKRCQRNWIDTYDVVYVLTHTDEEVTDERDNNKD